MTQEVRSKKVSNAHDLFSKSLLANKVVAKQFLQRYVKPELLARMDLNYLELSKNSYIDSRLKARYTDVLYISRIDGKECLIYILIEHQSRPDKFMPVRMVNYLSNIWLNEIKEKKPNKVSFILPIVLYNGETAYPYPTKISDVIAGPADIVSQQFQEVFQLVDLNNISDEKLRSEHWLDISLFFMKHIRARNIMQLVHQMREVLVVAERAGGCDFIVSLFSYIMSKGDINEQDVEEFFMRNFSEPTREGFMTGAERLINRGFKKGIQQGMQQGLQTGRQHRDIELIRRMHAMQYQPDDIAKITQLPIQYIHDILKQQSL